MLRRAFLRAIGVAYLSAGSVLAEMVCAPVRPVVEGPERPICSGEFVPYQENVWGMPIIDADNGRFILHEGEWKKIKMREWGGDLLESNA